MTDVLVQLGGPTARLLLDRPERIRAIMTVAAGSGYWRDYVPALRRFAPALWYAIVPLVLPLFGYFPGRRLGMITYQ